MEPNINFSSSSLDRADLSKWGSPDRRVQQTMHQVCITTSSLLSITLEFWGLHFYNRSFANQSHIPISPPNPLPITSRYMFLKCMAPMIFLAPNVYLNDIVFTIHILTCLIPINKINVKKYLHKKRYAVETSDDSSVVGLTSQYVNGAHSPFHNLLHTNAIHVASQRRPVGANGSSL